MGFGGTADRKVFTRSALLNFRHYYCVNQQLKKASLVPSSRSWSLSLLDVSAALSAATRISDIFLFKRFSTSKGASKNQGSHDNLNCG